MEPVTFQVHKSSFVTRLHDLRRYPDVSTFTTTVCACKALAENLQLFLVRKDFPRWIFWRSILILILHLIRASVGSFSNHLMEPFIARLLVSINASLWDFVQADRWIWASDFPPVSPAACNCLIPTPSRVIPFHYQLLLIELAPLRAACRL